MSQDNLHITLLVYGTLKRGQWNHDRFCRNAIDIRPATIVGRLYELPAGGVVPRSEVASLRDEPLARLSFALQAVIPAVVIPKESILAHGTADPLADARTQAEFSAHGAEMPEVEGDPPSADGYSEAGWDTVHGEIITFADPARDLPPVDRLEGFRPGGNGLYRRALVAVDSGRQIRTAWVYHMPGMHRGDPCSGGYWCGGE